mmetsp:Transcript_25914/g.66795  ORF Transcript_25914/g.66795 Transcript_25914/m.66795 type:complete len:444 (+) Transcript_25914:150-1481(+)
MPAETLPTILHARLRSLLHSLVTRLGPSASGTLPSPAPNQLDLPQPLPPVAPQQLQTRGCDRRLDEYRWMESPSPMLAQHLQAEDAYSRAMLKRLGVPALQQQLMHEMQAREQPPQATDPPQPPPTHAPLQTPDPPPEQIGPWLYWHADLGSTLLRRSAPGPAAEGTHAQRSTAAAAASASEACRLAADCRSSQRSTASGEASLNAGHNRQACWNSLQEPSGNLAAKGSSAQHSAAARAAAAAAAAQVPGLGSEWVHELREDAVTQQELLGGGRYPQSEESGSVEVVVDGGVLCAARDFAQQELGLQLEAALGALKLSRCQRFVAMTLPLQQPFVDGNAGTPPHDLYCCVVRNISTGALLKQGLVPGVSSSIEFSADGSALLATHPDELGRPCKVMMYSMLDPDAVGAEGAMHTDHAASWCLKRLIPQSSWPSATLRTGHSSP